MQRDDPIAVSVPALAGGAAAWGLGSGAERGTGGGAEGSRDPAAADRADDEALCAAALAQGSRTFQAAACLLPRRVRLSATALYAFCRMADDAVDGQGLGPHLDADVAVAELRRRLQAIYAGEPDPQPEDRAMAALVRRHGLPIDWPMALIEGFAWDAEGRRYETLEPLLDYAARVAGTVGVMMAALMGVRSPVALARAADLGVAMQLSNIARDVGEDAAEGRLYLPRSWMREAGLDPEAWLSQPQHSPALGRVIERLLTVADGLYERAATGVPQLPADCRPAIEAARRLYRSIGHEVRRRGLDAVSRRAVVSPGRKLLGLGLALASCWRPADGSAERGHAPPLAATRFLVLAAARPAGPRGPEEDAADERVLAESARTGSATLPAWWQLRPRLLTTLQIFERQERQRRLQRARLSGLRPPPVAGEPRGDPRGDPGRHAGGPPWAPASR